MPRGGSARREAAGASGPESLCTHMRQRARTRCQAAGRAVPMRSVRLPHVLCRALVPSAALPLRLMASAGAGEEHLCSDDPMCWVLASRVSPAGILGPVLPHATSVACPDRYRVRQLRAGPQKLLTPGSAPADALWAVWACRPPLLPDCCCAPVLVPTQRPPPGGWRAYCPDACAGASPTLVPSPGHLKPRTPASAPDAPSEGGPAWGSTTRPPWRPADPGPTAG